MVPNGWKRIPIKEACESIIDCVNKTAPVVDYETPFKMIRTTNVRNGRVNTEDVRYVTEDTYLQWVRRGKPQVGDIIFTREAPVGEVGVLEDAEGIFLGQRIMMYRADSNRADNYYLFYSLLSTFCQKQISDFSNGGTVAHMRVPDCSEILINLPPLSEQKKIAIILSTWDQAISTTEQLLANSQQQKKALMQQLLTGKKRLLDKNGVRFSGEWRTGKLSSLVGKIFGGGTPSRANPELWGGKIPWVTVKDLISTRIDGAQEFINERGLLESSSNLVPAGTVILSTRMAVGKTVIASCDVAINQDLKAISSSEKVCSEYLFYWFLYHSCSIEKMGTGSTVKGVQIDAIKALIMSIPAKIEEQQKIALVLTEADQEIAILQRKLDCLKQEKKALMQALLTGKRRVVLEAAHV